MYTYEILDYCGDVAAIESYASKEEGADRIEKWRASGRRVHAVEPYSKQQYVTALRSTNCFYGATRICIEALKHNAPIQAAHGLRDTFGITLTEATGWLKSLRGAKYGEEGIYARSLETLVRGTTERPVISFNIPMRSK